MKSFLCYLHAMDACTLHLFQSNPIPQFLFLRHSLLASLQEPYRFFQCEILKPRPLPDTPPASDWLQRVTRSKNTSGSHVLDACLQTLYRSRGTGHHLMRIAGTLSQRLIEENKRTRSQVYMKPSVVAFHRVKKDPKH